jgi:GNAT superfamily N-acetyltransferase
MTTIVIMPGGFHPFHAGHAALYQSAQQTFPDADVYVAATDDTSTRPFPFQVKEKLAQLAGVNKGRFMRVKSPFRADEITAPYNPAKDVLIFVRSEKDTAQPPQPGGVKKDGSPSYLQPLLGAKKLEPFAKHAYMAYLPTVEFGPGMTSATEIRSAWPRLNEKRKTALVMSLYPKTQTSPQLAQTVVKLLDAAIGGEQGVAEGLFDRFKKKLTANIGGINLTASKEGGRIIIDASSQGKQLGIVMFNINGKTLVADRLMVQPEYRGQGIAEIMYDWAKGLGYTVQRSSDQTDDGKRFWDKLKGEETNVWEQGVGENQGWAATFTNEDDYIEEKWSSKYKNSINCAAPQGFSQRAHCAGRKK